MMPYPSVPMATPYNVNPYTGSLNPYDMGYTAGYSNNSISSNTIEQQLNSLQERLNILEQKVDKIETSMNNSNSNKYNNSNYYMV